MDPITSLMYIDTIHVCYSYFSSFSSQLHINENNIKLGCSLDSVRVHNTYCVRPPIYWTLAPYTLLQLAEDPCVVEVKINH